MLLFVFQRLWQNKWLTVSLLLGLTLAAALLAGIPIYTQGVLQNVLMEELEDFQLEKDTFPGTYLIAKRFTPAGEPEDDVSAYPEYDRVIRDELVPDLGLDVIAAAHRRSYKGMLTDRVAPSPRELSRVFAGIEILEGIEEHITVRQGRLFAPNPEPGVMEAVVTPAAMQKLNLFLGETYLIRDINLEEGVAVRLVGVFTIRDPRDAFWYFDLKNSSSSFFVDPGINRGAAAAGGLGRIFAGFEAEWFYALSYYDVRVRDVGSLLGTLGRQARTIRENEAQLTVPALSILQEFRITERNLRTTLLLLNMPILIMLVFFLFMVASIFLDRERTEIALLKSRGATTRQIVGGYLATHALLALSAMILGPPLGFVLSILTGSARGFVELGGLPRFPVRLSVQAYLYALGGSLFFLALMLASAVRASRLTIVIFKQQRFASRRSTPLWKRAFLDVVLLAVAAYGLYSFHMQKRILAITGMAGSDLPLNPLFFLVSILFILGMCLLFLRLYPLLMRLLFRAGRRIWPPEIYASFVQISRSGGYERFVLVFLTLTVALGVFNATAARTINQSIEERILYANGADVSFKPFWWIRWTEEDLRVIRRTADALAERFPGIGDALDYGRSRVLQGVREPPFDVYRDLEGAAAATRVFRQEQVSIQSSRGFSGRADLMAVVPPEFGRIAWFRSDLLPYHWYEYLNVLAAHPNALLVSSALRTDYYMERGQGLRIQLDEDTAVEGVIYAFVDYWPAFLPFEAGTAEGGGLAGGTGRGLAGLAGAQRDQRLLVVGNYSYLIPRTSLEPYEVWIRRDPSVADREFYTDLVRRNIRMLILRDSAAEIMARKSSPSVRGMNGVLTVGFFITLAVSFVGFLLCWVLSVRERTLQFGVIRALGLSKRQITVMLLWEQAMVTMGGLLAGTVVGGAAGQLFVPILQATERIVEQVPPLQIGALLRDYGILFGFIAVMLLAVLAALRLLVSRLRVSQALKLGEE